MPGRFGRYGASVREPSEWELVFAVLVAVMSLAGVLYGAVFGGFTGNPGFAPLAWWVVKAAAFFLSAIALLSFVLLKRGCDDQDPLNLSRGYAFAGGGFLITAVLMALLEYGALSRGGTRAVWTGQRWRRT